MPTLATSLNTRSAAAGPVIYWMSRDQRARDNRALLHAQKLAIERQSPLAVVFALAPSFLGATLRQYGFMLKGLQETAKKLSALNIPFFLLRGDPVEELTKFAGLHKAGSIVTDFDPLRIKRRWQNDAARALQVPLDVVDAHNIVPCRLASDHQEYGAYTLRPKIRRLVAEYLVPDPPVIPHPFPWTWAQTHFDPDNILKEISLDRTVQEVGSFRPGEDAAMARLDDFLNQGLANYDKRRNDPCAVGESGLSPYLHFGQIAPLRVALAVAGQAGATASGEAFLEQLIVRRELADNFCLYNDQYDSIDGFPEWSRKNLEEHRSDRREYCYAVQHFEGAATHDPLWNAAQTEMASTGKMHGYMRMYWVKKILEWSATPEMAMATAIYLNDRYELDGRDPNGYTGIAWGIGGVHDRAWPQHAIFGKVRYMNDNGCRRKFDVPAYIARFS